MRYSIYFQIKNVQVMIYICPKNFFTKIEQAWLLGISIMHKTHRVTFITLCTQCSIMLIKHTKCDNIIYRMVNGVSYSTGAAAHHL